MPEQEQVPQAIIDLVVAAKVPSDCETRSPVVCARCRSEVERDLSKAYPAIRKEVLAEVRDGLPDPEKLRRLANWFDAEQRATGRWADSTEVQDDLRKWADFLATLTDDTKPQDER